MVNSGVFFVIVTCFFIPLSTSLMGISAGLVVLFWILSGRIFRLPQLLAKSPVSFVSLLLFVLFVVGVFYSPVGYEEALDTLKKYRELVFIPAVISLMKGNKKGIQAAQDCFIAGCIILLLTSYGIAFSILPPVKFGNSILYHITHSFFMAILAFWSAHRAVDSKQYRYFWIVIFVAVIANLAYICPGRTGMIILVLLMLLFISQRLSWKKQLVGLFVISSLLATAYLTSENVSTRFNTAWKEIHNYEQGKARSSMGMRFDWYNDSLQLIQEKPIFGHGTGSFAFIQKKAVENKKTMETDNPHNEYLFIGVQLGYVGLITFVLLFIVQWLRSFNLSSRNRWLVQGVILSMAAGCLMNSFLFDSHQGHFFAFLSAIFYSSTRHPHPSLTFR